MTKERDMISRRFQTILACMLIAAAPCALAQEEPKPAADSGMDDKQKTSYAVGQQFGQAIAEGVEFIDVDAMVVGLKDAMNKQPSKVADQEMGQLLQKLQQQIMENRFAGNKTDGEAFLAENGKKEGVKTTASGLQYKVITEGKGRTPKATDTVSTHYRGTFLSGQEFDSSYKRDEPAEFPVNEVIPGWTEALQLMKEGGKLQLWVPYALAYGDNGRPPAIPPFSMLIFEVELLKIVDAAPGEQSVTIKPKAQ
jgi:FKBP-type peptidyl-prolyl cis-trans isomerase